MRDEEVITRVLWSLVMPLPIWRAVSSSSLDTSMSSRPGMGVKPKIGRRPCS